MFAQAGSRPAVWNVGQWLAVQQAQDGVDAGDLFTPQLQDQVGRLQPLTKVAGPWVVTGLGAAGVASLLSSSARRRSILSSAVSGRLAESLAAWRT